MSANIVMQKGSTERLSEIGILDGQILIDTDKKEIFIDDVDERKCYTAHKEKNEKIIYRIEIKNPTRTINWSPIIKASDFYDGSNDFNFYGNHKFYVIFEYSKESVADYISFNTLKLDDRTIGIPILGVGNNGSWIQRNIQLYKTSSTAHRSFIQIIIETRDNGSVIAYDMTPYYIDTDRDTTYNYTNFMAVEKKVDYNSLMQQTFDENGTKFTDCPDGWYFTLKNSDELEVPEGNNAYGEIELDPSKSYLVFVTFNKTVLVNGRRTSENGTSNEIIWDNSYEVYDGTKIYFLQFPYTDFACTLDGEKWYSSKVTPCIKEIMTINPSNSTMGIKTVVSNPTYNASGDMTKAGQCGIVATDFYRCGRMTIYSLNF